MTNQIDEATYETLKAAAQAQFKQAATHGDTHPEGIAMLMDNGMVVDGFSLPKAGRHAPAESAATSALKFLGKLFGEAAMEDGECRPGQTVIAAVIATAIANSEKEALPKLKQPSTQILADLAAYKGAKNLETLTVVSANSDLSFLRPLI